MSPKALLFLIPLLALGCVAPSASDEGGEGEALEDALSGADTVLADADADGVARAQVKGLTLTFDKGFRVDASTGERLFVIPGRVSKNVKEMRSFVPDDAFGEVRMRGPRSFDLVLRGDHEINTMLSGLPLGLSIETTTGSIRKYEAAVHLGVRMFAFAGSTAIRLGDVRAVSAGTAADTLRYRLRVSTTKTFSSLSAESATAIRRSPRIWELDWSYAGVAPILERQGLVVAAASPAEQMTTSVEGRVMRLGLTTKTSEEAWPNVCASSVRSCLARITGRDLGACGTYREVETCQNEEPPPPPNLTAAAAKVSADILGKTGVSYAASVMSTRVETGKTIALASLPRGGSAEWIVAPSVSFLRFVDRPELKDEWQVTRFQKQLRTQHAMPNAVIVAHGSPLGMQPRWQFVVDRAGVRSMVPLEATSESTSVLIPFAYDERAFREIAGHLVLDHALGLATQSGPYAELEVYLRTSALLATSNGLELLAPSESPVGFDPVKEVQLAAPSVWGDVAVYVTIVRATGAVRVEDFN